MALDQGGYGGGASYVPDRFEQTDPLAAAMQYEIAREQAVRTQQAAQRTVDPRQALYQQAAPPPAIPQLRAATPSPYVRAEDRSIVPQQYYNARPGPIEYQAPAPRPQAPRSGGRAPGKMSPMPDRPPIGYGASQREKGLQVEPRPLSFQQNVPWPTNDPTMSNPYEFALEDARRHQGLVLPWLSQYGLKGALETWKMARDRERLASVLERLPIPPNYTGPYADVGQRVSVWTPPTGQLYEDWYDVVRNMRRSASTHQYSMDLLGQPGLTEQEAAYLEYGGQGQSTPAEEAMWMARYANLLDRLGAPRYGNEWYDAPSVMGGEPVPDMTNTWSWTAYPMWDPVTAQVIASPPSTEQVPGWATPNYEVPPEYQQFVMSPEQVSELARPRVTDWDGYKALTTGFYPATPTQMWEIGK